MIAAPIASALIRVGLAVRCCYTHGMEPALDKMSTAEKLRLMEALWDDLTRNPADVESPPWHGQVLADRQARVDRGEAQFADWDEAKQRIRDATQ